MVARLRGFKLYQCRDALARAIDEIVSDRAKARRMAVEARRLAMERFSLESMMNAYESLYERLAERRVDARA